MTRKPYRLLAAAISAMLLLLFLYSVAEILFLFFLALLGSLYLGAITDRLQHWFGLPRRLGLLGAILATLLILVGIGWLIVPALIGQGYELWQILPEQLEHWDGELQELALRSPVVGHLLGPLEDGESYLGGILPEAASHFRDAVPYLFDGVGLVIKVIGVVTMAVFLALRPAFYREGAITLVPPVHRQLVRSLLADLSRTLRAWILGQLIMMTALAVMSSVGLHLLGVPYALSFGVFTGAVSIVPVFGTLLSLALPVLFLLGNASLVKIAAVLLVGIGIHIIETNVISPMVMEHQVHLPPVLTLLSVLIMGNLLGVVGVLVAVPTLASCFVIIKWLYVDRILQGKGFRRIVRDRPVEIRLPNEGVLIHPIARGASLPSLLE